MKDLCRKFLKILHVELEDLEEDLDLFVEVMESRRKAGEITDYVYRENLAVIRNEVLGLKECIRGCDELDQVAGTSVEEVAAAIKRRLRERLAEHGYLPALYALLDRRIDKIASYLKREIAEPAGPPQS